MSLLFSPLTLRSVTLSNRIAVSPMCQYSATDGIPNDWHLVHLGSRAVGGAGLVIAEATAVEPRGRISPEDVGIWNDEQVKAWQPITRFIKAQGSVPGIQLAHAGRKAFGDWVPVAPTTEPFPGLNPPEKLEHHGSIVRAFVEGAIKAVEAGFEVIEIHAAHGYLLHEFYSPLTNEGSLEERIAVPVEVTAAVRAAVGPDVPVLVRISGTDWVQDGWTADDSVVLAQALKAAGADLIDVSSGGNTAQADIPIGPGYQVPLAEAVRRKADVPTGAVGLITEATQAEQVLNDGSADLVLLAREMLRDPYWPLHAARQLGAEVKAPRQYARAF
ncbi:2,4-dienoyl-CoA reductase-like NADH-dependent reductase (Old Yellow Enzyme family) [Lentzea atacamensis]|uniref:2,4-dienoyl-CoA reductase-like NADH-dependent reductase (Old Yellow Enzyme family) n=1 Tax=Lentzea atacamensis TaxID=531938 RepID=A0ABX9EFW7_9PSEU|nr:NADH:flavin oxidoreductase/NADH oxidase [Lentzea atacamensis]RAS68407.1 2,4-dienoyl-CoA reductase-like NADH-dependent reductase (Old Yellow Enzyme family) [Lentzea atacamensis]